MDANTKRSKATHRKRSLVTYSLVVVACVAVGTFCGWRQWGTQISGALGAMTTVFLLTVLGHWARGDRPFRETLRSQRTWIDAAIAAPLCGVWALLFMAPAGWGWTLVTLIGGGAVMAVGARPRLPEATTTGSLVTTGSARRTCRA